MEFNIIRSPLIKTKTYCPNPIVVHGIPSYADGVANPKVIDTAAYNDYWKEQLYYVHNGYTTGGIYIPGRYYKFINFDRTQTVKGAGPLEVHDYQLDYALWVDDLKRRKKHAYIPKARRKAVSVMTTGMVIDYGWRFETDYHGAVVAGLDEYSQDFMDKWRYVDAHMVKEFKLHKIDNKDHLISGWRENSDEGWLDKGSQNTVYIRTVNNNPNVLKGKFLHDIVLEESGENELLLETIQASEDCLKFGGQTFGTFWIYGTGGNMDKGSKGFKHIHQHLDAYNAQQWYVPSTVFYFPCYAGAVDEHGNNVEDIPNLHHLQPHERVGISDVERAKELINKHRQMLLDIGDMDKYFEFCRNNPIDIKEIFRKTASNNFDIIKLNEQQYKIESGDIRYHRMRLEYKKNPENGAIMSPMEIVATPAKPTDSEDECVYILNDGHPVKGYRWLDVAGIDSYDQDQAKKSKSLGAMCVFRRNHSMPDMPAWCPVAVIRNRPKYKEQFYELCLKMAIYYDLVGTVLVDVGAPVIIKYFEDAGQSRLLSLRPKKFESVNSKQTHMYGVSLNSFSKPQMISTLQSFFAYHCEKVWFEKILDEALNYDEFEVDSDNDLVDAMGIALMKAIDIDFPAQSEEDILKVDAFDYPEYGHDTEGNLIVVDKVVVENNKPLGVEEDYFSRFARMQMQQSVDEDKANDPNDVFSL